jgi:RimJ/RimL family protein N-acetyltransferase
MFKVRAFDPNLDLELIELQPEVIGFQDAIKTPTMGQSLDASGPVYTGEDDGKIIAIVGLTEYDWSNSAVAWALFSHDSGPYMRRIYKHVKAWMELQTYQRLEVDVQVDFVKGHKFANLFGFVPEGIKRKSTRDGKDEVMYSIIQ